MVSSINRFAVATLLLALFIIAVTETSGNPAPANDVNSVADAIRYLQDLENKHQFARPRSRSVPDQIDGVSINALIMILDHLDKTHSRTPRFGKRGNNDYLTKEYTNNYLRYLLENPPESFSNSSFVMKMNSSKASSFDPYDYYKKLTQCLARKKNTKVTKVPGLLQHHGKQKTGPLITKHHMQAKFLAKYNQEKQQQTSQPSKSSERNSQKHEPIAFKVKTQEPAGTSRKKKLQESYINLPPSFFNSFDGPDMSIFKVPEVPVKRQKQQEQGTSKNQEQVVSKKQEQRTSQEARKESQLQDQPGTSMFSHSAPQDNHVKQQDPANAYLNLPPSFFNAAKPKLPPSATTNVTMGSINSANFDPKTSSTPVEKNAPMTSDPDDVFKLCEKKPKGHKKVERFLDIVDETSKSIDAKIFAQQPDPIIEIMKRVKDLYDLSCQSPRLINETLMSVSEVSASELKEPELSPPIASLPLPKFYDEHGKTVDQTPRQKMTPSLEIPEPTPFAAPVPFEKTADIFRSPLKSLTRTQRDEIPNDNLDELFLDDSLANFTFPNVEFSPFSTQESADMSPAGNFFMDWESRDENELDNTFELFSAPTSPKVPKNSQWKSPATSEIDNSFAIFNSPPKPTRASQRGPSTSHLPNPSHSTYLWTPYINQNPSDLLPTTSNNFGPFQSRNIFKNQSDLF